MTVKAVADDIASNNMHRFRHVCGVVAHPLPVSLGCFTNTIRAMMPTPINLHPHVVPLKLVLVGSAIR